MSDLIDREKAMNAVADAKNILEHMDTVNDGDINRVKRAIERILAELPTVDAVPVIRCKDCKYYFNSGEKCMLIDSRLHFYETDKRWTEDCFCSWAERKEE